MLPVGIRRYHSRQIGKLPQTKVKGCFQSAPFPLIDGMVQDDTAICRFSLRENTGILLPASIIHQNNIPETGFS